MRASTLLPILFAGSVLGRVIPAFLLPVSSGDISVRSSPDDIIIRKGSIDDSTIIRGIAD